MMRLSDVTPSDRQDTKSRRRQGTGDCALFAVCCAFGWDYPWMVRKYQQVMRRPWGEDSAQKWAVFVNSFFYHRRVTPQFFGAFACDGDLRWNARRFVKSTFDTGGTTHIAFADEQNLVHDGIFDKPLPFAQYVRELGQKGGIILGYCEVPK